MTAIRTHYDVLGVSPETPPVVIKAAFRALAKEYHPDSSAEAAADPERFIELQDAYAVLSDPVARSSYDGELRAAIEASSRAVLAPQNEAAGDVADPASGLGTAALRAVHARFLVYSDELAAGFREAALTGRSEDELLSFAEAMEDHFLQEYFGQDRDVRAVAKLLLLRCRKTALVELNDLVSATSGPADPAKHRFLAGFIERHFADDRLILPWLREKFAAPPPRSVAPVERPLRKPPRRRARALRSVVKVACLSGAVYLGLLVVSAAGN